MQKAKNFLLALVKGYLFTLTSREVPILKEIKNKGKIIKPKASQNLSIKLHSYSNMRVIAITKVDLLSQ